MAEAGIDQEREQRRIAWVRCRMRKFGDLRR